MSLSKKPRVVILGGGFGGLACARKLGKAADITLIDQRNHHVFQPLLYQVATAGLSPADISAPIRAVLSRSSARTANIFLATVTGVDREKKYVACRDVHGDRLIPFDYLVVATGARHSYFGHDEWERVAFGLKSIEDATALRRKILLAFEAAESEPNPALVEAWLTFVVVGGGPTGVELAGALSELSRRALARDFHRIDPAQARVVLVEAGPRLLSMFSPKLSAAATKQLESMGVIVKVNTRVGSVTDQTATTSEEELATRTILWAAGVKASPVGEWLDAMTDPQGRVLVDDRCHARTKDGVCDDIFVIGDAARFGASSDRMLPGVAPVAMQQGRYVGSLIKHASDKSTKVAKPFRYVDKGNLATIGRGHAVGEYKNIRMRGLVAWVVWAVVHVYYLIGFRNRALVLFEWAWAYFSYQRGARLIVGEGSPMPASERFNSRSTE